MEQLNLCVCVCVCVCVFAFLYDTSKCNRSRNTKFEYFVVYENSLDTIDIWALSDQGKGHGATLKFFSRNRSTNCQVL